MSQQLEMLIGSQIQVVDELFFIHKTVQQNGRYSRLKSRKLINRGLF